jgi:hypothetical protein
LAFRFHEPAMAHGLELLYSTTVRSFTPDWSCVRFPLETTHSQPFAAAGYGSPQSPTLTALSNPLFSSLPTVLDTSPLLLSLWGDGVVAGATVTVPGALHPQAKAPTEGNSPESRGVSKRNEGRTRADGATLLPVVATVLGVFKGTLFLLFEGDAAAVGRPYPAAQGRLTAAGASPLPIPRRCSQIKLPEGRCIKALNALDEICYFDCSREACELFGLLHGTVLEFRASVYRGRKVTVLGVRKDLLWFLGDGEEHAQIFNHCVAFKDIEKHYQPIVVGQCAVVPTFTG